MLKQRTITKAGLMFLPVLLLHLAGCTALGLGIGHSYDIQETPLPEVTPEEVEDIPEGAKVTALLSSGETIKGTVLFYSQPDSSLVILQQEEQVQVKLHELALLSVKGTGHSSIVIGTLIGAAIDIAIIAMISASMDYSIDFHTNNGSMY